MCLSSFAPLPWTVSLHWSKSPKSCPSVFYQVVKHRSQSSSFWCLEMVGATKKATLYPSCLNSTQDSPLGDLKGIKFCWPKTQVNVVSLFIHIVEISVFLKSIFTEKATFLGRIHEDQINKRNKNYSKYIYTKPMYFI